MQGAMQAYGRHRTRPSRVSTSGLQVLPERKTQLAPISTTHVDGNSLHAIAEETV